VFCSSDNDKRAAVLLDAINETEEG
jgi:hypothetical protein